MLKDEKGGVSIRIDKAKENKKLLEPVVLVWDHRPPYGVCKHKRESQDQWTRMVEPYRHLYIDGLEERH